MSKNTGIQPSHVVSIVEFPTVGKQEYRCLMSDGSIWTCNKNGENWEKEGLSLGELSEKFKEEFTS